MTSDKFLAIKLPNHLGDVSGTIASMHTADNADVLDFLQFLSPSADDEANIKAYSSPVSKEFYRNFLDWLFATFDTEEQAFRKKLIEGLHLKHGSKVLITGCGFGEDIPICADIVGQDGEIHAQDLSREMVLSAAQSHNRDNTLFTISNALDLPYRDDYFDAVFHFGGINLFGDTRTAIKEMTRVCKTGGRVVFGDEGLAPHLKDTEFGKIAIANIDLWKTDAPLAMLPPNAADIRLEYVLGNCFYVISFSIGDGLPKMNIDVEHKGLRGGSARSRYFGQLEGVTSEAKEKIYNAARAEGISVHKLLSRIISEAKLD